MLKELHKIISLLFSYVVQLLVLIDILRELIIFYIFKFLLARFCQLLNYRVGWAFYPKTSIQCLITMYWWRFLSLLTFLPFFVSYIQTYFFSYTASFYLSLISFLDWGFFFFIFPTLRRFTTFFWGWTADTVIEIIYYFFPEEKYNLAPTTEEEELINLSTLSQQRKKILDAVIFDIKTGVSFGWSLKQSLRFFSLNFLSTEQKRSINRAVRVSSPLLTDTGFFKNQNIILRLSKNFYHVNRRFFVLQELFANWWPTTTLFKQGGSIFFKSSSAYHPPLPVNFKLTNKWFDFSFFFDLIFFLVTGFFRFFIFCLFAFFPVPYFWKSYLFLDCLYSRRKKVLQTNSFFYFFQTSSAVVSQAVPLPFYENFIKSFQRWIEWHFFFSSAEPDSEFDHWSIESYIDFEPSKTFSDLEDDISQDFATLFDDAWPEFTENDLESEEEFENILEEVAFEQDEDYSSDNTESEDKPAKPWKPDEEKEESWLPWGDWVVFGKKFPEDDFLSALTWLLTIFVGGVMLVLDNRDLLQYCGDIVMDFYTFFIAKVSSWVFVGEVEWPWPANWNFYALDSSWGALDKIGWQSWSLTTDAELRLFNIHQFQHTYTYHVFKEAQINNFDEPEVLEIPSVGEWADMYYEFLPGDMEMYFQLEAYLGIRAHPGYLNFAPFAKHRSAEEEKLFLLALDNLTYFPRIAVLAWDQINTFMSDLWQWIIHWNPKAETLAYINSFFVSPANHRIIPELMLRSERTLHCEFPPHFVQNYTWRFTENDEFLLIGPTWREIESMHVHEWAQENQYWDYNIFWKNQAFSHILQNQYPLTLETMPAQLPHETRLRWLLNISENYSLPELTIMQKDPRVQFMWHKWRGYLKMIPTLDTVTRQVYPSGAIGPDSAKYRFIKPEPFWLWQSCHTLPPALRFSSFDTPILWPWHVADSKLSGWAFNKDWDRLWDVNLHWYWGGVAPANKSFFSKSYGDELQLRLPNFFNNYDNAGESVVHIPSEVIASKKFIYETQWYNPFIITPAATAAHTKMDYTETATEMFDILGGWEAAKKHREGRPYLRIMELDWFIEEGWGYPLYKGPRTFVEILAAERVYTVMFSEFSIWTELYQNDGQLNTTDLYWPMRDKFLQFWFEDLKNTMDNHKTRLTSTVAHTQDRHLVWRFLRQFHLSENVIPKTFIKSTPNWETGENPQTLENASLWNFTLLDTVAEHTTYPTSFLSRWSDLCADDFWSAHQTDEDDLESEDVDTPFESAFYLEPDDEDDEDDIYVANPWSLRDTGYRYSVLEKEAKVKNGFLKNSEDIALTDFARMSDEPDDNYTYDDVFMDHKSATQQDMLNNVIDYVGMSDLRVEMGDEDEEQDYIDGDDVGNDELVGWPDLWTSLTNWYEAWKTKSKNLKPILATVEDEKGGVTLWPEERFWWPQNFWSRDNNVSFFGPQYWANLFDLSNWNQHLFVNRQSPSFNYVRPQAVLLPTFDGWSFEVESTLDCFWTNMGCSSEARGRRAAHGDENLYLEFWGRDPIVYNSPYSYPSNNDSYLSSINTYGKYTATRRWGFPIPRDEYGLRNFPVWGESDFGRHTWGWWDFNRWGLLWWVNLDVLLDRDRVNENPEFWSYRSPDWSMARTSSDAFFKAVGPRPFLSRMQHDYSPVTDKDLTSLWTARLEVLDNRAYGRVTVPKIKHFLKSTEDIYARATGYIGQCIELYNRNQYADYQGKYFNLDRPSGFAYRSISDSVEALRLLRVQNNQNLWFQNPWSSGFVGMPGLETLKLDTSFQTFYNYPRPYYDSVLEWKLEHANYTVQKLADGSERRLTGLYFDGYEDRVRLEPAEYFQKLAEENKNNPAKFSPETVPETVPENA